LTARGAALALTVAAGAALCGCGLGAGEGPAGTSVTVTRDFGARTLGSGRATQVSDGETAMRQLQRGFDVQTRYGGGFVQAIDGLAGGTSDGRRLDWFFYVNGIEAGRGAAATRLHPGDRVWWDRHDWGAAMSIPAVVGSFPEPFRSGSGGKRLPVTIACARDADAACDEVARRLDGAGASAGRGPIGGVPTAQTLRVVVGPWPRVRVDLAARRLERGPAVSGVFARPAASGRWLWLLDARGRTASRLGAGAGLVAATRDGASQPTWVVTGVDRAGLMVAARSLDERKLARRFGLAVTRGQGISLPVEGRR
jgi:hypothetical protein